MAKSKKSTTIEQALEELMTLVENYRKDYSQDEIIREENRKLGKFIEKWLAWNKGNIEMHETTDPKKENLKGII